MNKLYIFPVLLLCLLLGACSDDPATDIPQPGAIENDGDERVSVLHLAFDNNGSWEKVANAEFSLVDPANHNSFSFKGAILHNPDIRVLGKKGAATCRLAIGSAEIPDGDYYVSISGEGVPDIGIRLVRFSDCIGTEIAAEPFDYEDLSGNGTESDPYLIGSSDDFLSFMYFLGQDPQKGYGRCFRQTASFDLPQRSIMIDGRIWLPVTFSGVYDGGGYSLKSLIYQGASSEDQDSKVGLFEDLYLADIRHVKIENAMIVNAASIVGVLAGMASSSKIDDITISGTVMGCGDLIGGLIGSASGETSISNIKINSLTVNGTGANSKYIGGVLGQFVNGTLTISGVSTPDHIFSVTGNSHVGGIIGYAGHTSSSITLSDITLEHSVDQESSTVKVIYANDKYAGGIIGYFEDIADLSLKNVSVKCPVRGHSDIGAISGHAVVSGKASIEKALLSSVVKGDVSVGGFFGYLGLTSSGCSLKFKGADNSTRYVVKSSASADVEGGDYTGGVIGYFEANKGSLEFDGKVEIAVNVSGNNCVGGAIGFMNNIGALDLSGFNFSSSSMRVSGTQDIGGVIGKSTGGTVSGPNKLDLFSGIPSADKLISCYGGVVEGKTSIGGIVGSYSGTLTGAASNANVTASSDNAGGIVGYFSGDISHCAFFGNVTCANKVAGIYGTCKGEVHISDCLNLADISGGEWQAGIAAYTHVGRLTAVKVERCFNKGNLTDGMGVGGIMAYLYKQKHAGQLDFDETVVVSECGNSGNISAKGNISYEVAGIVGYAMCDLLHVLYCANHGNIYSSNEQDFIAGVVGRAGFDDDYNWIVISQCMNSGKIDCHEFHTNLGGVVGCVHSGNLAESAHVRDCYNTGDIPPDVHDDTGGILMYAKYHTNTYRNFNRGKIGDGNAIIGTHKSGSLFSHSNNYYLEGTGGSWPSSTSVSQSNLGGKNEVYNDFDFDNVWEATSEGPVLRHCPFQYIK